MKGFAMRFAGVVFVAFLLSGCSIIENATRYSTDLSFTHLNEDLTVKYRRSPTSKTTLYLPGSRKFAELEYDSGDMFFRYAYTTKKTLNEWDDIFQRFLDWKSGPNEVLTLTDPVATINSYNPLVVDQDLKFMNIRGEKYLVFTIYQPFPFSDRLFAYNEENVILMKDFFKSLNYILVN